MITKFSNHITKNIRTYYKKKLIIPTTYICCIFLLSFIFPIFSFIFPKKIDFTKPWILNNPKASFYTKAKLKNLFFTGYTRKFLGQIDGYYYYTFTNNKCLFVLLKPNSCDMGLPELKSVSLSGKIITKSNSLDTLFTNLSRDLSWNEDGVRETFFPFILSEPDSNGISAIFLYYFIIFTSIFSMINIVYCIICINFPLLSHPIRRLTKYGNPKKLLKEAEDELSTLPQLATDDMFITQHYFIETSKFGVALIPIDKIRWVYKYSTLHMLFGKHLKISYTLYITGEKSIHIKCPKNTITDIDGIIDYLCEANHNILVGFNEKNREIIEGESDMPELLIKLRHFLMKRV